MSIPLNDTNKQVTKGPRILYFVYVWHVADIRTPKKNPESKHHSFTELLKCSSKTREG